MIMIVEDSKTSIFVMNAFFSKLTYDYKIFSTAKDALNNFNKEYKIALLDICLPGMDGFELNNKLKELTPELITIAITAQAIKGDKEKFLNNGFDYYMSKPYNLEELKELICTLI